MERLVNLVWLLSLALGAQSKTYADDANVQDLHGERDFSRSVFNSQTAWLVEFYQSTCGACKSYAPIFSAHAADVKAWSSVIKVAALNCGDEVNVAICAKNEVTAVPTVRLFPALHDNMTSDGKLFTGIPLHAEGDKAVDRSGPYLRQRMIDIVKLQVHKSLPWPNLDFVQNPSFKPSFDKSSQFGIVFQKQQSYLGSELTLDMLACPSIKIHVVTDENIIAQYSVHALPSLLAWNGEQKNVLSNCSRESARDVLLSLCGKVHRTEEKNAAHNEIKPLHSPATPGVYMTDLVSTLAYIVHREISLQPVIHGSALEGLSQFLQAVHYCMPLPPKVRHFVVSLLRQLRMQKKSHTLSSVTWARLKSMQTSSSFLPHAIKWVGCAGSAPDSRGYPCGLWTLFHTVTTHCALLADDEPVMDLSPDRRTLTRRRVAGIDGRWALLAVRDYVEHFFSCDTCRKHFLEMSAELKSKVVSNHEAVMWLWSAHNQVNQRLAKDSTADPAFPKVQFPPVALCGDCHQPSSEATPDKIEWNKVAVLKFLMKFYGPDGIRWTDSSKSWEHDVPTHFKTSFHGDSIPNFVYYVGMCFVCWAMVLMYFRRHPMPWRRHVAPFKNKQHMWS